MPGDAGAQVETTCAQVQALVELGAERFGAVGRGWLSRFLAEAGATRP